MNSLKNTNVFESIKHIDEFGNEFWYAREIMVILDYKKWQKFNNVINNAKVACSNSNNIVDYHFTQVGKMIEIAKGAKRKIIDYKLSRYACYLIAQNGDSRKEVIALAQTYFAIQTRKQELFEELSEDEKRLEMRKKVKEGNFGLNRTALNSGVKNLAEFHNAGYKGLYNGETANDIFKRKKLRYREDILDNMGSVELGANLFRITQTDDKLKRDKVNDEYTANSVHYKMCKDIRNFIENQGGIMPEKLPNPKHSLKELEKDKK
jgi:DNA-damage-inducible protein D